MDTLGNQSDHSLIFETGSLDSFGFPGKSNHDHGSSNSSIGSDSKSGKVDAFGFLNEPLSKIRGITKGFNNSFQNGNAYLKEGDQDDGFWSDNDEDAEGVFDGNNSALHLLTAACRSSSKRLEKNNFKNVDADAEPVEVSKNPLRQSEDKAGVVVKKDGSRNIIKFPVKARDTPVVYLPTVTKKTQQKPHAVTTTKVVQQVNGVLVVKNVPLKVDHVDKDEFRDFVNSVNTAPPVSGDDNLDAAPELDEYFNSSDDDEELSLSEEEEESNPPVRERKKERPRTTTKDRVQDRPPTHRAGAMGRPPHRRKRGATVGGSGVEKSLTTTTGANVSAEVANKPGYSNFLKLLNVVDENTVNDPEEISVVNDNANVTKTDHSTKSPKKLETDKKSATLLRLKRSQSDGPNYTTNKHTDTSGNRMKDSEDAHKTRGRDRSSRNSENKAPKSRTRSSSDGPEYRRREVVGEEPSSSTHRRKCMAAADSTKKSNNNERGRERSKTSEKDIKSRSRSRSDGPEYRRRDFVGDCLLEELPQLEGFLKGKEDTTNNGRGRDRGRNDKKARSRSRSDGPEYRRRGDSGVSSSKSEHRRSIFVNSKSEHRRSAHRRSIDLNGSKSEHSRTSVSQHSSHRQSSIDMNGSKSELNRTSESSSHRQRSDANGSKSEHNRAIKSSSHRRSSDVTRSKSEHRRTIESSSHLRSSDVNGSKSDRRHVDASKLENNRRSKSEHRRSKSEHHLSSISIENDDSKSDLPPMNDDEDGSAIIISKQDSLGKERGRGRKNDSEKTIKHRTRSRSDGPQYSRRSRRSSDNDASDFNDTRGKQKKGGNDSFATLTTTASTASHITAAHSPSISSSSSSSSSSDKSEEESNDSGIVKLQSLVRRFIQQVWYQKMLRLQKQISDIQSDHQNTLNNIRMNKIVLLNTYMKAARMNDSSTDNKTSLDKMLDIIVEERTIHENLRNESDHMKKSLNISTTVFDAKREKVQRIIEINKKLEINIEKYQKNISNVKQSLKNCVKSYLTEYKMKTIFKNCLTNCLKLLQEKIIDEQINNRNYLGDSDFKTFQMLIMKGGKLQKNNTSKPFHSGAGVFLIEEYETDSIIQIQAFIRGCACRSKHPKKKTTKELWGKLKKTVKKESSTGRGRKLSKKLTKTRSRSKSDGPVYRRRDHTSLQVDDKVNKKSDEKTKPHISHKNPVPDDNNGESRKGRERKRGDDKTKRSRSRSDGPVYRRESEKNDTANSKQEARRGRGRDRKKSEGEIKTRSRSRSEGPVYHRGSEDPDTNVKQDARRGRGRDRKRSDDELKTRSRSKSDGPVYRRGGDDGDAANKKPLRESRRTTTEKKVKRTRARSRSA